jgi:hypothetical protein
LWFCPRSISNWRSERDHQFRNHLWVLNWQCRPGLCFDDGGLERGKGVEVETVLKKGTMLGLNSTKTNMRFESRGSPFDKPNCDLSSPHRGGNGTAPRIPCSGDCGENESYPPIYTEVFTGHEVEKWDQANHTSVNGV